MHRKYFIYVHEKDCYDLYLFSELVRTISNHFVIQFENPIEVLQWLSSIQDGHYPAFIIVDLRDLEQAHLFIFSFQQLKTLPTLPILILLEKEKPLFTHKDINYYERPQSREAWEQLANIIVQEYRLRSS